MAGTVPVLIAFAAVMCVYGPFSKLLEGTPVTAPMVFVAAGLLAAASGVLTLGFHPHGQGHPDTMVGTSGARTVAEIALVLLLFTDAARVNLRVLRTSSSLPLRLLVIGLPLTIGLGGLVALWLFDGQLSLSEAFIVGAVLAPTDAALGAVVVSSPLLPVRIRQALDVEAGLNDGLAVPFFTVFVALAAQEELGSAPFLTVTAHKLVYGVLIGAGVGLVGAWVLRECSRRGWMTGTFQQLTVISMALVAWWAAEHVGGSGLIAAFVGGLASGYVARGIASKVVEFTEDTGQLLSLLVFFAFGVVSIKALHNATWKMALYAVISLTVLRMAPVAVSLLGTGMRRSTVAFIGWFGPRGLASILLALIISIDHPMLPGAATIYVLVTVTVLVSVFAHGITAAPLTKRYAQGLAHREPLPEHGQVPESLTRHWPRTSGGLPAWHPDDAAAEDAKRTLTQRPVAEPQQIGDRPATGP